MGISLSWGGRQGKVPKPVGVTWDESRSTSLPGKENSRGGRGLPGK